MLRFAMIGAGRISSAHARSFITTPDAELTWVADPFPGAAERIAALTGARATLDPAEAIEASDVDAVLVSSPTPTHVDMIIAAARLGKPVLCEKPIDLSLDRVAELSDALQGLDARVMMGFNRRFDPSFADIHARVQDGEIGEVEQIVVISRDPAAPPEPYVISSGGIFKDMTIHDFDIVRFFLPDIVSVEAVGQNVIEPYIAKHDDYDGAVTTLHASNGAIATIINSRRCVYGYDQRLEVFGATGMLEARNLLPNSVRHYGAEHAERTAPYLNFFLERYSPAYAAELTAFVDTVQSGGTFSPGLDDGRAALALAEAAGEAARTGRSVLVPTFEKPVV